MLGCWNQPLRTRFPQRKVGGRTPEYKTHGIQFAYEAHIESLSHLREAVAQELAATAGRYAEEPASMYEKDPERWRYT